MVKRTPTRDLNIHKVRLVHSLRYGPRGRCMGARPLMALSAIAKILRVAVTAVHTLLSKDPADLSAATPKPRGRHPPLSPRQKGWLMSEETLRRTAHLTLAQRAVLFHRQFPERHVSPSTICKLYKQNKIRRKAIRFQKVPKNSSEEEQVL